MLILSSFFFFPVVLYASVYKAGLSRNTIIPDVLALSLLGTQNVAEMVHSVQEGLQTGTLWLGRMC